MQIVFFCPSPDHIAGGIKCIFRMAETLRRLGYDAVVYERTKTRPKWFENDAPIFGKEIFRPTPDQVLVMPEAQPEIFEAFAGRPQRKVVYCQSYVYAAKGVRDGGSFADYGVSHILCAGRAIYDYCRHRHPNLPLHLVPNGIDPRRFHPRPKRECIAFIPRKRKVEAVYLRDLFRYNYPEFRDIEWLELDGKSEQDIAEGVGGASVFLVLHRLDSQPLTGLEAMASGCVLAGFTGGGGREYARPENGFWADEDDFPACIRQLAEAVRLSRETGARRAAYAAACAETMAAYTSAVFDAAVRGAWAEILRAWGENESVPADRDEAGPRPIFSGTL